MDKEEFYKELEKINITLDSVQKQQLNRYYQLLKEWNEKINLTAIIGEKDVYLKHFFDSIMLSITYDFNQNLSICDIGTGAGFPGLILKIIFPSLKVTLVDSTAKKINFLRVVIDDLGLTGIETKNIRIEDYNPTEKYDIVTSRALAPLSILLELGINLLKVDGVFLAMKGNASEEIKNSTNALKLLNCQVEEVKTFNLPYENSNRTIIKIKKKQENDKKYPRQFDKIKKKPL